MDQFKIYLKQKRKDILILLLILLFGAFLYFWKINEWQFLSFDEARDYIIIKRILIDKKFTLIGPSLGILDGGYLPPFYYYLLAPSLLFSGFHIWGPDMLSALIAFFSIIAFFFIAKELFGKFSAFLGTLFFVFNPYLIQAARHTRDPHMLPLFLLIFFLSFKKYFFDKKRWFLLLAAISLAISISLHLTAAVFFPILFFLFIQEIKLFKISKISFLSFFSFLIFFLPLLIFDFRHSFTMSRAYREFFFSNSNSSFFAGFFSKIERFVVFIVKIPAIIFSGTFQKPLLSLRSMPLSSLENITAVPLDSFEVIKLLLGGLLWLTTIIVIIFNLKRNNNRLTKTILVFVFFGFLVSFITPPKATFLYYFYGLFPFLFLLLCGAISYLSGKFSRKNKILFCFLSIFLAILPLFPNGLRTEIRPEKYFIPACKIIAEDFPLGKKVVIASNYKDSLRWEHNAMEYRYFLEALYKLPIANWTVTDYQQADILYFIDEGDFKSPLNFKGMEMESFSPQKIEKSWRAESGQTIYKMIK